MTLDGRVAIVTGAASGIGRGIAAGYAAQGARLMLIDRDGDGLEQARSEIEADLEIRVVDITDKHAVEAAVAATVARFGRVDVLSHSAALDQPVVPMVEIDDELWCRIIDTNVTGTFYVNRGVLKVMLAGDGGSIINTVSDLGLIVTPGLGAYCTSKGAVLQLTRVLAAEAAPKVRVNAICPTMVDTPMGWRALSTRSDPEAFLAEIKRGIPMQRIASVSDVVGAAVFLASDAASYITGVALPIDGGRTVI